jgi:small subunit ribosomal protein S3
MATKVHPKALRLSTIETWDSLWCSPRNMRQFLADDVRIRAFLKKQLREAGLDKIKVDRARNQLTVNLYTAKPGMIIGRSGSGVEDLQKLITRTFFPGKKMVVRVNVHDMGNGSLSAPVVAEQVAMELEKRMPFRRVLKQTIDRVMKSGAQGVRVAVGGRLNGAEIARTEKLSDGKVPLQNLRADIQYAQARANTLFGVIGVKVWIYRGEVFKGKVPDTLPASRMGREEGRGGRGGRGDRGGRDRGGRGASDSRAPRAASQS